MFDAFLESKIGKAILSWFSTIIGKIKWRQRHEITADEKKMIFNMLAKDYYIICTRRGNHLSTDAINFAHWYYTGEWGYYSHVLMNLEDEVKSPDDFRLVEAVGVGSKYSTFDEVFDGVDSVALLKPKGVSSEEWTSIFEKIPSLTGKKYDTVFDMYDDSELSCVELVLKALEASDEFDIDFDHLKATLDKYGRLDPQMYRDCPDFEVVFEVRRGRGN